MPRTAFRSVVIAATLAATLSCWGVAMYAVADGADGSVREQLSLWTPIVLAPIIVVYGSFALGLVCGGWRLWRWIPAAVLIAAVGAVTVQASVNEAARAYEPEVLWNALFYGAPVAALVVVFAAERLRRDS